MSNTINWFEIPVNDFERAKKFYATVLDQALVDMPMPEGKMAMFPGEAGPEKVGGAIVQWEGVEPRDNGTVVYFNGGADLAPMLNRAEQAGAKVLIPKTSIGEHGFMAHFIDTEGNRIALHSMN